MHEKKQSGFEPVDNEWDVTKPCTHPEHQPPGYMVIPAGKQYRHVCPGCGHEIVIHPTSSFCRV